MKSLIFVLHASMNGTTKILGEAIAEGAKVSKDTEVVFGSVDEVNIDELKNADGIIWGSPGYFGNISPKMANFLSKLGGVWFKGELQGKIGGVFATTSNPHWGIENILRNLQLPMQALGMNIVSNKVKPDYVNISPPYGAMAICRLTLEDQKKPTVEELDAAKDYGRQVAEAVGKYSKAYALSN
jgi:NAD(P)H dehydrogenase (quinone)